MHLFTEGKAKILASQGKISRQLEIFYNPVMKLNRDISILLLNSILATNLRIADPLAGSGIRSIRFLLELEKDKINSISINDADTAAVNAIRKNLALNRLRKKKSIIISKTDASLFLLKSTGFDYIDVDPFGSPNPFLDAAARRIARNGVLAVTATDTAPLAGTYPYACRRKYWSEPLRNEVMHEVALRILIRKVQLIAAQYEKALLPLLSYSRDHYYRVFFRAEKRKTACDTILAQHKYFYYCQNCSTQTTSEKNVSKCPTCKKPTLVAGPLWAGPLHDKDLTKRMLKNAPDDIKHFITSLNAEAQHNLVGFYDLHTLSEKIKKHIPPTKLAIKKLREKGYIASGTHFSAHAVKTNAPPKEILKIF